MNGIQVFAFILWFHLMLYIPAMIMFYSYRSHYPIRGRCPRMALFEASSFIVYGTLHWCMLTFDVDCAINGYATFIFTYMYQTGFLYRLIQLLFSYQLTRDIVKCKSTRNIRDWKPNWFSRHRYLAQDKFNFIAGSVWMSVYIIIMIIYGATGVDVCNPNIVNVIDFFSVAGLVPMMILAGMMWKFPSDAFGIKAEFKYIAITSCIFILGVRILLIIAPDQLPLLSIGILLAVDSASFFCIAQPLWYAVRSRMKVQQQELLEAQGQQTPDLHGGPNLRQFLLTYPEGVTLFLDYLKREFSAENLFFWQDVQDYQKVPQEDTFNRAKQIYQTFIAPHAPCLINLPHSVSEPLTQVFGYPSAEIELAKNPPPSSIFDAAQLEIYRLMASDSFLRFLQTPKYIKWHMETLSNSSRIASPSLRSRDSEKTIESQAAGIESQTELEILMTSKSAQDLDVSHPTTSN